MFGFFRAFPLFLFAVLAFVLLFGSSKAQAADRRIRGAVVVRPAVVRPVIARPAVIVTPGLFGTRVIVR